MVEPHTEHEWIPCYVGMPNIGVEVEVKLTGGTVMVAARDGRHCWKTSPNGDYILPAQNVTHWRRTA